MNWVSGIVLYILIWWTALFAVLPIGTRAMRDADARSGWRGTPEHPRIVMKILLTTLVAAVLWLVAYGVIESDLLSFRHGWLAAPED
jgi:predicted secreted protein